MAKKILSLLLTLFLLCTICTSSFALDLQSILNTVAETDKQVVVLALPFICNDDGLDMLAEDMREIALDYIDETTYDNLLASLRVIPERNRREVANVYQYSETVSLNNTEKQGAKALMNVLSDKYSAFETIFRNHGITEEVMACFLKKEAEINGTCFKRSNGVFVLDTYNEDMVDEINAIWHENGHADVDLIDIYEDGISRLNATLSDREKDDAEALFTKVGLIKTKADQGDNGGNGNNGGMTIPSIIPQNQFGEYEIVESIESFEPLQNQDTQLIRVTKTGFVKIPTDLKTPVIYQIINGTLKPVKLGVLLNGAVCAELSVGTYAIQNIVPYFSDCDGWAKSYIEALYARGIINGKAERIFMPTDNITREEFVKLVVELFDLKDNAAQVSFKDINSEAWYYPYVASAYKYGIISGVGDNNFGVGANIKRQDMAKIICDVLKKRGVNTVSADETVFKDHGAIAAYAKEQVLSIYQLGIISGDESRKFNPNHFATRQEAAKMIYGMLEVILTK